VAAFGFAIAEGPPASAQASDPPIADLGQSGKLRVGVGIVAPHWAVKNSQTGELRGVSIEIARALAKRLGVEMVAVEYPTRLRF
jgi:polar amino acid transport system substrate-binding protein